MKNRLISFLTISAMSILWTIQVWSASATSGFDHSQTNWALFLKKNVSIKGHASTVNYKAIKQDPKDLQAYLASFEAVSLDNYNHFSENEKLAFLVNAYNALTIKLIVDHYPIKSIKDIGGFFSSPWKVKFFKLLGEQRHLDNLEHDMIRKWFNEPRIHFAVVCASVGCPALKNEAYVASKLDQQLEDASVNFLSDANRNRYHTADKKLELSSLFKWYGDDFVKKYGTLETFIAPRITNDSIDQKNIQEKKASISYLDYDWSLNEDK